MGDTISTTSVLYLYLFALQILELKSHRCPSTCRFETVTIALEGEIEHGDSMGNRDVIGSGDVQWMTAGRGIIHEEVE
jgi:hypothetical protein